MKHPGSASGCRLETPVVIIVAPVSHQGRFTASLTDGSVLVASSRQPFFEAARQLIKLGYDPATVLVVRHVGSDIDCLTATAGEAAKLAVREDRGPPRFIQWEPGPRRVEALASAKAERVTRTAFDHANEPSARPGAAVATQFPSVPVPKPSRPKRSSATRRG